MKLCKKTKLLFFKTDALAFPSASYQFRHRKDHIRLFPRIKIFEHIRSHQPIQLRVGIFLLKMRYRTARITRSARIEFIRADFTAANLRKCQFCHVQPIRRRSEKFALLVRRYEGRYHDDLVCLQFLFRRFNNIDMFRMNGIKRPAENRNFHSYPSVELLLVCI